jgi:hypothetical protein
LPEQNAIEFTDGEGGIDSPSEDRSVLDLFGDFDFDLVELPTEVVSCHSLYLAMASCRSASFVETTKSSLSASSIVPVPEEEPTTT